MQLSPEIPEIDQARNARMVCSRKVQCRVCHTADKRVLELHNPNPENKSFPLAQAFGHTVPEVIAELEKVECLCIRCRRIETI